jgi:5-methylcytosine-specific restriction enzyme A
MPFAPMRPCAHPRCGVLVTKGRCRKHARQQDQARGTATQRGYNTPAWRAFRRAWLEAHPFCGDRLSGISLEHSRCEVERPKGGPRKRATDVDHIVRVSGPLDARFFDLAAVQSLCHACHATKTRTEERL